LAYTLFVGVLEQVMQMEGVGDVLVQGSERKENIQRTYNKHHITCVNKSLRGSCTRAPHNRNMLYSNIMQLEHTEGSNKEPHL
ncbi:MAG: hypothetical protein ACKPKO_18350, partial [Candidatus Fonsibacter sp.]